MPVNLFFNNYKNKQEQNLIEDLINESIKMMGFDAYYIPNENEQARDLLFGDDPLKKFNHAYPIEVYLSNSMDPGVSSEFFSKFGLEIKNHTKVQLSRRTFAQRVDQGRNRPREGDLIYIPFLSGTGELYEIKFVNDAADFFTLGRKYPYYWELELELFKYSHDEIDTGIDEVDFVNDEEAYAIEYELGSGSGNYIKNEIVYQGTSLESSNISGSVLDWNSITKKLKLSNIRGEFSNTSIIIGATSNSRYTLITYDPLQYPQTNNAWDNKIVEDESELFIDKSESNPLGML